MLVDAPAGAAWRRIVSIPVGDDVVASMTYDISDVIDLQARVAALSEHVWDVVAITDAEARLHVGVAVRRASARLHARPISWDARPPT